MNFHKFGSHDRLMQNCFRTDYTVGVSNKGSEEWSQKQSFWPNSNSSSSGTIMEHIGSPASAIFLTELYMGLTQYDHHESAGNNPQMLKMSSDLHIPSYHEQPGSCLYADSQPVEAQPHHLSSTYAIPAGPKSQPLSINQHMMPHGSYRNPFSNLSEQEQLLHLKCKLLEEYDELNKRQCLSPRKPDHEHGLQASCNLYNPQFTNPKPVGRPCGSVSAISSNSASSGSAVISKTRIRWTQELHDRFVECVSCLGGADKATPKAILKLMDWEGLTIFHVKSHLQKYRNAKCPESAEGRPDRRASICSTTFIDGTRSNQLKEALQLQLDVQKKLHEQLEDQRKLQLSIEEQARQLKVIFDKQQETTRSLLESQNSNNATSPTTSYLSMALENAELLNPEDHEGTHFSSAIS